MGEDAERIEGELRVHLTARWLPTDATNLERPWLRAELSNEGGYGTVAMVPEEPGAPSAVSSVVISLSACTPTARTCEWTETLQLELQPDVGAGTAEVEWRAEARMYADNTDDLPKGFKVEVFEP